MTVALPLAFNIRTDEPTFCSHCTFVRCGKALFDIPDKLHSFGTRRRSRGIANRCAWGKAASLCPPPRNLPDRADEPCLHRLGLKSKCSASAALPSCAEDALHHHSARPAWTVEVRSPLKEVRAMSVHPGKDSLTANATSTGKVQKDNVHRFVPRASQTHQTPAPAVPERPPIRRSEDFSGGDDDPGPTAA